MKWLWKEKSTEAVLEMLRGTRVGCIRTRCVLPGERLGDKEAGSGDEGEEGGPPPPEHVISFLSSFGDEGDWPFFLCLFSFVYLTSFLC